MEEPASHLPRPSQLTNIITSRLQTLANEIDSLIETLRHGKLQPTNDEYKALEAASLTLGTDAGKVSEEVQALGKRRTEAVYTEGRKLLSMVEATRAHLNANGQLKHRATFIRNIQLLFGGPNESKLDSTAIRARKRLNRERCERIRMLGAYGTILWAATFNPSLWDANMLPKATFDYVIEFMELHGTQLWPYEINAILSTLRDEEPLQGSDEFERFLDGMYDS
jgi:hypothetical protein